MKLGLDLYSVRLQDWTVFEQLDYCHRLGLQVAHLGMSSFDRFDDAHLDAVRDHAESLGLTLEFGMGSICPSSSAYVGAGEVDVVSRARWALRVARRLGSPILRTLLGSRADRYGDPPLCKKIEDSIATCRAVREDALELGVTLAIENHNDLQAWELRELIERAGPDYVGALIDTGNSLWVHEDPLVTLEGLAPYIVASHVRDCRIWPYPEGAAAQWVALGDGNVGIAAWTERYRELCPQAPYTLEVITGRRPTVLSYLRPEYWDGYPEARAAEFARFERLVRQGQPFMGYMAIVEGAPDAPSEYGEALRAQQLYDVERSIDYAHNELGIGVRDCTEDV